MSIYQKPKQDESYFLNLLILDFELNKTAINMQKSREKLSYEQLYKKHKDNEKVIIQLQEKLADKKASDIKIFFYCKHNRIMADKFLKRLYMRRERTTDKRIISKAKYILERL